MTAYSLEARRESDGVLVDQVWCHGHEDETFMRKSLLARLRSMGCVGAVTVLRVNPPLRERT